MATTLNFTKKELTGLKPPAEGKRLRIRDAKQKGLYIDVTPNGTITFYFRQALDGEMVNERIGPFGPITIEQARMRAAELASMVARGENPNEHSAPKRGELTLGDLFQHYIDTHGKKSTKTWAVMEKDFARNSGDLAAKKLSRITNAMAEDLHSQLAKERGRYTANRTIQLLRAVFNKGKRSKLFFGENPFEGITLYKEQPRERFLTKAEAKKLLTALEVHPNDTLRDFITLCLFMGLRKNNLMSLRWDYIDLDEGTLRLPDTKNGTIQTIALGEHELAILKSRESDESPWVFPGADKSKHMTDIKKAWMTFRDTVKLGDCTIHDLRRSLGSSMANANVNIALVKNALHHKDIKTTLAVYARTQDEAVKQAKVMVQNQWLQGEVPAEPQGNVTPFKRKAKK